MLGYGLDPIDDLPDFKGRPSRFYLVCSTPRCGSSLLGSLLTATSVAGKPLEYYNPFLQFPLLAERFGSEDLGVLTRRLFRLRTSPNGVFGFKAHFDHFQFMTERLDPRRTFPGLKFLHLVRKDLLRQGISYYRAKESGVWSSLEGEQKSPEFSFEKIEVAINDICRKEAGWRKYFALTGFEPLEILYEDLLADPSGQLARIGRFLEIRMPKSLPAEAQPLERQRDSVTEEWVAAIHRHRIRGLAGVAADLLAQAVQAADNE